MNLKNLKLKLMKPIESFEYDNYKIDILYDYKEYFYYFNEQMSIGFATAVEAKKEAICYLDDKYINIYEKIKKKLDEIKLKTKRESLPTLVYKGFNIYIIQKGKNYIWRIGTDFNKLFSNKKLYPVFDDAIDAAKDYIDKT